MQFFAEVNEGRNVIQLADDFWPLIETLRESNHALRMEMMSSDRFRRAMAMEEVRQAAKAKDAPTRRPPR
jgi:hypothetical protein